MKTIIFEGKEINSSEGWLQRQSPIDQKKFEERVSRNLLSFNVKHSIDFCSNVLGKSFKNASLSTVEAQQVSDSYVFKHHKTRFSLNVGLFKKAVWKLCSSLNARSHKKLFRLSMQINKQPPKAFFDPNIAGYISDK